MQRMTAAIVVAAEDRRAGGERNRPGEAGGAATTRSTGCRRALPGQLPDSDTAAASSP